MGDNELDFYVYSRSVPKPSKLTAKTSKRIEYLKLKFEYLPAICHVFFAIYVSLGLFLKLLEVKYDSVSLLAGLSLREMTLG